MKSPQLKAELGLALATVTIAVGLHSFLNKKPLVTSFLEIMASAHENAKKEKKEEIVETIDIEHEVISSKIPPAIEESYY